MSKEVQIGNAIYEIPVYGENRWGEKTTALLEALTSSLSNLVGPQDILTKESNLANNVSVPAPINGLKFDTSLVESSIVEGVIVRTFTEASMIEPMQCKFTVASASFEGKLEYSVSYVGDAGVRITAQDDGQFYYTSLDIADTESIFAKYYGKAITQTEI
jgi:hypothetical protein